MTDSTLPRLAVFGASRGVGRHVVQQALARGHQVTAVARHTAELRKAFPAARLVEGDATDAATVRAALDGVDAVICTLGAPAWSRSKVRSEGTRTILEGMERAGLSRILVLGVLGAAESREHLPFTLRYLIFPLYLRRPVAEHEAQERILRASGLDWTILRAPYLEEGPRTGRYALGFGADLTGLTLTVSRADAADFFLDQVGSAQYARRTVEISYAKAARAAGREVEGAKLEQTGQL